MHTDVAIIIPARLGSTRLSEKSLQLIGHLSMIERVFLQVKKTGLQNIYVATDSADISKKIVSRNGQVILTSSDCPSGTDRIHSALMSLPNRHDIQYVVNVQGDLPFVEPESILKVIESLKNSTHDIMTPVATVGIEEAQSTSNVKVVIDQRGRALYFSRNLIPYGSKEFLYHIGIYGFRKAALSKFVELPMSYSEKCEKLEQLRALESGMTIGVCHVKNIPISVDTEDDLNAAKEWLKSSVV